MKHFNIFITAGLAILATSCGNIVDSYDATTELDESEIEFSAQEANETWSGDSFSQSELDEFNCPSKPNVMPDFDRAINGTNRYRVCVSKKTNYSYLVEGESSTTGASVCLIPATYVNPTQGGTKAGYSVFVDPTNKTKVLKFCYQPSDLDAARVSFQEGFKNYRDPLDPKKPVTINGFFIVTEQDLAQMQVCLKSGIAIACPAYSFGRL
jgi:hypothetical protein